MSDTQREKAAERRRVREAQYNIDMAAAKVERALLRYEMLANRLPSPDGRGV